MKDCNYHHFLCFLRWAMDLVHGIGKWLTTHQLSSIPPSSYCWKQGISRGWGCHYVYPIIHLSIYLSNPTYKYTCVYTYTLHILYRIYIYLYLYLNIIFYIDREAMGRCGPELFLRGPCARGTWRPFQRLGHGEVRRWQFFSAGNSPRKMVMGIGVLGIHD
jgi:hypothetical protein